MKKLIMVFLHLAFFYTLLFSQSKVWNYPIRPGSAEWVKAQSFEERLGLYNIPLNRIKIINTEDLVTTCLNYPELRMIMAWNNLYEGYSFLKKRFNGFRELEKRNDAGRILLSIYEKTNHDDVINIPGDYDKGRFMANIIFIEIILSQDSILSFLSEKELLSLKAQSILSYESILRLNKYFSIFPLEFPALMLCKIQYSSNKLKFNLNQEVDKDIALFLKYPHNSNRNVWEKVYKSAKISN